MNDWQKAELYFEKYSFKNAIELYQRVLEKNPKQIKAKLRIAESYTYLNEPRKAVRWYAEANDYTELTAEQTYNYAQSLSAIENYEEAKDWYQTYQEMNPEDPRARLKIDFINNLDFYQRNKSLSYIEKMPFNSSESDFGAIPYEKGLLFLSARDQDLFIKYRDSNQSALEESDPSQSRLDLYYTYFRDTAYVKPEKLHDINTRFHEGPLTFYHTSRKVIFTRNNFNDHRKRTSKDGKIKLKLFFTDRNANDEWMKIESFAYNDDEYSTGHPTLSLDDQVLYFSSDMPGGYGGSDLYFCQWQDGNWGTPINMGAEINTPGNEMFPFISHDGKLYFSSDGHGGFGGLDIYRSYKASGSFYENVENIGTPLNSSWDDFSFVLNQDGRSGYISSNRSGEPGNDDIYQFSIKFLGIVGRVYNDRTNEVVPDASVTIHDTTNDKDISLVTDDNGYFHTDLPISSEYSLEATKEGYSPKGYSTTSTFGNKFGTDTVNVFMWKHELFAQGRIYSNESHELLSNVKVTIENLNEEESEKRELITDENGEYFYVLRPDNRYKITAEKPEHISKSFIMNTEGMIADTLRNDIVLEEQYMDKSVIFFAFDDDQLNGNSITQLNEMVKVLKRYKETFIVVSAHADAQGTFDYNKRLSDKRAKSVVNYLLARGIRKDRITWYGFGEELLLNKCSDGVECEEEDHSKNRRAELKIEDKRPADPKADSDT